MIFQLLNPCLDFLQIWKRHFHEIKRVLTSLAEVEMQEQEAPAPVEEAAAPVEEAAAPAEEVSLGDI